MAKREKMENIQCTRNAAASLWGVKMGSAVLETAGQYLLTKYTQPIDQQSHSYVHTQQKCVTYISKRCVEDSTTSLVTIALNLKLPKCPSTVECTNECGTYRTIWTTLFTQKYSYTGLHSWSSEVNIKWKSQKQHILYNSMYISDKTEKISPWSCYKSGECLF